MPDIGAIDLSHLTLYQVALVIAVCVIADLVTGVLSAWSNGTFDWSLLDQFLTTHLLHKGVPVALVYGLTLAVPAFGPALTVALAAYVIDTVTSVYGNVTTAKIGAAKAPAA